MAFAIWTSLSALCLSLSLWCLLASAYWKHWLRKALAITAVVVSYTTWLGFSLGQTSLFNLAFVVATLCLLKKGRTFSAGLIACLTCIKLQYAPALFITGLIVGKSRFMTGFALGIAALISYAALVLGVDNIVEYPRRLLAQENSHEISGVFPTSMPNVRGYLSSFFGNDNPISFQIAMIFFVVTLGVIAWLWLARDKQKTLGEPDTEKRFKFTAAIVIPLMLLSSVHTHMYDYVLLSVSCIWLWELTEATASSAPSRALRALMLIFPIYSWAAGRFLPQLLALHIQPFFIWAVALIVFSIPLHRTFASDTTNLLNS